jgi:acyl-ACP thioesterase
MKIENNIFSTRVPLYSFQVDSFNHAHLASYLQILQEAAARHSYERNLGVPQLREQGLTWVLARTKVMVNRYAPWPTDLDILTWPQEPWKLYFPRGTKVLGPDGEELCRSLSQWVVMDLSSHRPVKPQNLANMFGVADPSLYYSPDLGKRVEYSAGLVEIATHVPVIQYVDADLNGHVNNIVYAQWMIAGLPHAFLDNYQIAEFDIAYLAETMRHDTVAVRTGAVDDKIMEQDSPILVHEIRKNLADGTTTPVSIARTSWKRREPPVRTDQ